MGNKKRNKKKSKDAGGRAPINAELQHRGTHDIDDKIYDNELLRLERSEERRVGKECRL